jgi:hypothetical protein
MDVDPPEVSNDTGSKSTDSTKEEKSIDTQKSVEMGGDAAEPKTEEEVEMVLPSVDETVLAQLTGMHCTC